MGMGKARDGKSPDIAQLIRQLRLEAGLSQAALAKKLGTTQPAIARLQSANYNGHSLFMLRRIVAALNRELLIDLPEERAA